MLSLAAERAKRVEKKNQLTMENSMASGFSRGSQQSKNSVRGNRQRSSVAGIRSAARLESAELDAEADDLKSLTRSVDEAVRRSLSLMSSQKMESAPQTKAPSPEISKSAKKAPSNKQKGVNNGYLNTEPSH